MSPELQKAFFENSSNEPARRKATENQIYRE